MRRVLLLAGIVAIVASFAFVGAANADPPVTGSSITNVTGVGSCVDTGTWSATSLTGANVGCWTGGFGFEPTETASISVDIAVGDTGDLSFAWGWQTTDVCTYDWSDVSLITPDGTISLAHGCACGCSSGVATGGATIEQNLVAWAHQTVTLVVTAHQDGYGDQFRVTIDNTSLTDVIPPAITAPNLIVRVPVVGPVSVTFPTTAVDGVDGTVPLTCSPVSGSLFPFGTTPVTCHASDSSGNTSTATFNVSLRNGAVDSAPFGSVETQDATVAFSVSIPKSEARCSFDGAPEKKCSGSPLTFHGLAPGPHSFCIRGLAPRLIYDPLPDCATWSFDPPPPLTTITGAVQSGSNLTLTFISDQPGPRIGSGFHCALDNGPMTTCSSGVTFHGLAGTPDNPQFHCIFVQATNSWGVVDPFPDNVVVLTPDGGAYIGGCDGPPGPPPST